MYFAAAQPAEAAARMIWENFMVSEELTDLVECKAGEGTGLLFSILTVPFLSLYTSFTNITCAHKTRLCPASTHLAAPVSSPIFPQDHMPRKLYWPTASQPRAVNELGTLSTVYLLPI